MGPAALSGSQSREALEVLTREEANYRTAVRWAVADQQHQIAAALGHIFQRYLERSGRLRERDVWVQWLRDAVTQAGFTKEAAAYERQTIDRQSATNNTAGPDWWDPGTRFLTAGRTSLIVDPPNLTVVGEIPL